MSHIDSQLYQISKQGYHPSLLFLVNKFLLLLMQVDFSLILV